MAAMEAHVNGVDNVDPPTPPPYVQFLRSSTDLVLVAEGKELLCHRRVLAAESKVFADMLEYVTVKKGAHTPF
jgi:hypothetical protein